MIPWRRIKTFINEKILVNWKYKLSALAAAIIIWAYVAGQQSMTAVYSVPVYFQNLPTGMVMTKRQISKVEVTISGRRDRILSLKERQIWASINLNGMQQGINTYPIKPEDIVAPQGIDIKVITPSKLKIYLTQESKPQ